MYVECLLVTSELDPSNQMPSPVPYFHTTLYPFKFDTVSVVVVVLPDEEDDPVVKYLLLMGLIIL